MTCHYYGVELTPHRSGWLKGGCSGPNVSDEARYVRQRSHWAVTAPPRTALCHTKLLELLFVKTDRRIGSAPQARTGRPMAPLWQFREKFPGSVLAAGGLARVGKEDGEGLELGRGRVAAEGCQGTLPVALEQQRRPIGWR